MKKTLALSLIVGGGLVLSGCQFVSFNQDDIQPVVETKTMAFQATTALTMVDGFDSPTLSKTMSRLMNQDEAPIEEVDVPIATLDMLFNNGSSFTIEQRQVIGKVIQTSTSFHLRFLKKKPLHIRFITMSKHSKHQKKNQVKKLVKKLVRSLKARKSSIQLKLLAKKSVNHFSLDMAKMVVGMEIKMVMAIMVIMMTMMLIMTVKAIMGIMVLKTVNMKVVGMPMVKITIALPA